jgi:hypothetical protein
LPVQKYTYDRRLFAAVASSTEWKEIWAAVIWRPEPEAEKANNPSGRLNQRLRIDPRTSKKARLDYLKPPVSPVIMLFLLMVRLPAGRRNPLPLMGG